MNETKPKKDDELSKYDELSIKYHNLSTRHQILCQDYISLIKQMNNLAKIIEKDLNGGLNEIKK